LSAGLAWVPLQPGFVPAGIVAFKRQFRTGTAPIGMKRNYAFCENGFVDATAP